MLVIILTMALVVMAMYGWPRLGNGNYYLLGFWRGNARRELRADSVFLSAIFVCGVIVMIILVVVVVVVQS